MKHFDITILEDLSAFGHQDLIIVQFKILSIFIELGENIIVERHLIDEQPEIMIILNQDNFTDYFNRWTN